MIFDYIPQSIRLAEIQKERDDALHFEIPLPNSVKTNKLLQDQLDFLVKSAEEARNSDSSTRRIALRANTIAIIAAIMATIPVIIEQYNKFIK